MGKRLSFAWEVARSVASREFCIYLWKASRIHFTKGRWVLLALAAFLMVTAIKHLFDATTERYLATAISIPLMALFVRILTRSDRRALEQLARDLIQESKKRRAIKRAPGWRLDSFARALYSKRTYELVFLPCLSDLQSEYADALAERQFALARWIAFRGRWSFFAAAIAHVPVTMLRVAARLWATSS